MLGIFKRKSKCKHEWCYVTKDYIYTNNGCDVDVEDACWIFCLKCEKDELVYKEEWERINKKQEIIRLYRRD